MKYEVRSILEEKGILVYDEELLEKVIALVKDRCTFLTDFYQQSKFFFEAPQQLDVDAVKPKWNNDKKTFFETWIDTLQAAGNEGPVQATELENQFKLLATEKGIKPGDVLMPLRVMLVGGKFGPGVFDIAVLLGKEETIRRINSALQQF